MNNDSTLGFIAQLAELCRNQGVRRCRVGEVELELAVVRNPIADGAVKTAPVERPSLRPGESDWADAMGGLPVVRKS